MMIKGELNSVFVEQMMGFPKNWTSLEKESELPDRLIQDLTESPVVIEETDNNSKRLMTLGNAIVPQVAFQIFKTIMEVEKIGELEKIKKDK